MEPYAVCVSCNAPSFGDGSLCAGCIKAFDGIWCVGELNDVLRRLMVDYKFNRVRESYLIFAELLDATLPQLPVGTIVTPIPTVRSHVRQRGYDHTVLIAREFAKRRGYRYFPALNRVTTDMQRGANRKQRIEQAGRAFVCAQDVAENTYLLIDDVLTTGATVGAASAVLKAGGAKRVWAAVIARQPLEKTSKI